MDYDTYLSNQLAEYEYQGRVMCKCDECGGELYEGQECYYIKGNYICQKCVDESKVELDYYYDDLLDQYNER